MGTRSGDGRAGGRDSVVADVAMAVADAEGTDPAALTPPIGDVIDVDALQTLLVNSSGTTSVRFEYRGRDVEIRPDGDVVVGDVERAR